MASGLVGGCKGGDPVAKDLEKLCAIATHEVNDLPPDRRMEAVARKFTDYGPQPETIELMKAMSMAAPARRPRMVKDLAAKHGLAGFDCPALFR